VSGATAKRISRETRTELHSCGQIAVENRSLNTPFTSLRRLGAVIVIQGQEFENAPRYSFGFNSLLSFVLISISIQARLIWSRFESENNKWLQLLRSIAALLSQKYTLGGRVFLQMDLRCSLRVLLVLVDRRERDGNFRGQCKRVESSAEVMPVTVKASASCQKSDLGRQSPHQIVSFFDPTCMVTRQGGP